MSTVRRDPTPWADLSARERRASQLRRTRQLERSLQARRDAGDRDGAALAAAWLAEAQAAS